MKKKLMQVVSAVATSVLTLMCASNARAQLTEWPILNGYVVQANYPNTQNTPQSDTCGVVCAEGFTIGTGAYITEVDMWPAGANFTGSAGAGSSAVTCTFTLTILTRNPDNSLGFQILSPSTETVTIPANNYSTQQPGQFVPLSKVSISFPSGLWMPPGGYYLIMDNTNGCTGASSPSQGLLDWNLDAPAVAAVGPAFSHMGHPFYQPDWLTVYGTYAFDLIGPLLLPPTGGSKLVKSRLVLAGPVTPPPGGPVQVLVGFLNVETGTLLSPLTPITISPGPIELQYVDFDLTPLVAQRGQRIEVQPMIVQSPFEGTPGPIQLSATVQTLDRSTGFQYVSSPVPQPGGSLPGGSSPGSINISALSPQILAGGQTMRFDVLASGTDPCVAQVSFNDVNGNPLIPASSVNLAPGTGTIVDLESAALNLRPKQEIEVQPMLTATAPVGAVAQNSVCNASVEVFDGVTGHTWSHQSTMVGLPAVSPAGGIAGVDGTASSSAGKR